MKTTVQAWKQPRKRENSYASVKTAMQVWKQLCKCDKVVNNDFISTNPSSNPSRCLQNVRHALFDSYVLGV